MGFIRKYFQFRWDVSNSSSMAIASKLNPVNIGTISQVNLLGNYFAIDMKSDKPSEADEANEKNR